MSFTKQDALDCLKYQKTSALDLIFRLTQTRKPVILMDDRNDKWTFIVSGRCRYYLLAKSEHMSRYEEIDSVPNTFY